MITTELLNLVDGYTFQHNELSKTADKIGNAVYKIVQPIIPDIIYSINDDCIINFYSDTHTRMDFFNQLSDIIEGRVPALFGKVKCPYGLYLSYEEYVQLDTLFKEEA